MADLPKEEDTWDELRSLAASDGMLRGEDAKFDIISGFCVSDCGKESVDNYAFERRTIKKEEMCYGAGTDACNLIRIRNAKGKKKKKEASIAPLHFDYVIRYTIRTHKSLTFYMPEYIQ